MQRIQNYCLVINLEIIIAQLMVLFSKSCIPLPLNDSLISALELFANCCFALLVMVVVISGSTLFNSKAH